ncbi:aminoalkylphosphonate N-acetyltransferase [Spirosoma humi]
MLTQSTLPTDVYIRPATEQDALIIYNFVCLLEDSVLDVNAFKAVYQRNLRNPDVYYLVAEQTGSVLGFVSCHVQHLLHHTGKVGEIQELFVEPAVRSQGIGHQLVAALNTLAQQENFINLEVTTNQKRLDTIRFYERELFIRTHVKLVKPLHT